MRHLSIRIGGNARAAPATVSGEPLSKCATDAVRHWEGQTAVMTREPRNVLGRVSRCVACKGWLSPARRSACVRSAFCPQSWGMPMSIQSIPVATLGVPRIGPRRELKAALESYWSSKSDATALREAAAGIRAANWSRQHALGITHIPSNDFMTTCWIRVSWSVPSPRSMAGAAKCAARSLFYLGARQSRRRSRHTWSWSSGAGNDQVVRH